MFTRKTISAMPRQRSYFFKYLTMFFLGASAVMLATQAFDISTSLTNAVQYINKIILTSNGSNSGTTGIVLDGTAGTIYAAGVTIGDTPATSTEKLTVNGTISYVEKITSDDGLRLGFDIMGGDYGIYTPTDGNIANYLNGKFGYGGSWDRPTLTITGSTATFTGFLSVGTGISSNYKVNVNSSLQVLDNVSSTPYGNIHTSNGYMETWLGKRKDEDGIGSNATHNYGMIIHALDDDMIGLRVSMQGSAATAAIFNGGKVAIGTGVASALLTVEGGIKAKRFGAGANPCVDTGAYPAGTIFYNGGSSNGMYCFCNELAQAKEIKDDTQNCP